MLTFQGVTTTSVSPTTFKTTMLEENISTTDFKTSSDPSYSSATTVKLLTLRTTSTPISHPSTSNAPTSKSSTLQTAPTYSPFVTNPSPSSVTTSKLSTLLTSLTTLSSVTNPSSSVAITSKSSTFQTTPKISFQTTSKTSPSTTNPGTSSATTSKTSTSQTTLTASSSYTEDESLYTRVTSAEFSSAAPANIAAVTSGHTDEDSASGFIGQPTGIILTSVGAAALLTTGGCVGRRMLTKGTLIITYSRHSCYMKSVQIIFNVHATTLSNLDIKLFFQTGIILILLKYFIGNLYLIFFQAKEIRRKTLMYNLLMKT